MFAAPDPSLQDIFHQCALSEPLLTQFLSLGDSWLTHELIMCRQGAARLCQRSEAVAAGAAAVAHGILSPASFASGNCCSLRAGGGVKLYVQHTQNVCDVSILLMFEALAWH